MSGEAKSLENDLSLQLNQAWTTNLPSDESVRIWQAHVYVVVYVEDLRFQVKRHPVCNGGFLGEGDIHVVEAGTCERCPWDVAEQVVVQGVGLKRIGRRIEPMLSVTLGLGQCAALVIHQRVVRLTRRIEGREVKTAAPVVERCEVPTADDTVGETIRVIEKLLIPAERQNIVRVEAESVLWQA